ncbi:MAG: hypothetical protein A2283_02795 [Lentisphaerae bacterium RIFOXYA12_FULL_48_11]|nr:MAG: hypothetical protein A2283_02795 [Lentisphaerae bacterium RIFOXYA12_FULL_48_11]
MISRREMLIIFSCLMVLGDLFEVTAIASTNCVGQIAVELGQDQKLEFVRILDLDAWAGKFEVTNGQYRRFRSNHDSGSYKGFDMNQPNQPVVRVSWEDALMFCKWLNSTHGKSMPAGYVCGLPSEKEWESCARCDDGRESPWPEKWPDQPLPPRKFYNMVHMPLNVHWWNNRTYPWGQDWPPPASWRLFPPPDNWNYAGEECARKCVQPFSGHNDDYPVTCSVAKSGMNDCGLYGMGGNVWEWCDDWYDVTNRQYRVVRGGAWDTGFRNGAPPKYRAIYTVYLRSGGLPEEEADDVGFRLMLKKGTEPKQ